MKPPLPRLLLIADRFTDPRRADVARRAVAAGVPWVQLRDHEVDAGTFARAAEALVPVLQAENPALLLSINTHLEVARRLGLGLHVGWRGPGVAEARQQLGPDALLGYSAHNPAAAQQAAMQGADYVLFSPVFAPISKPAVPAAGLAALAAVCQTVTIPVLALGGITPGRVPACLNQGAYGVAVVSAILEASDPERTVQQFLHSLSLQEQPQRNSHDAA
ncbi:thiamine phosphate synthase [Rhodothermus profundi]|uniref:Thiamine-phosphate synthase n=1 Tax=Rhodothermus profundi TaxID=633813 RepID=A0A1M6TEB0_9BACT|nr:thiamine phosphate synthase [Rhodothermus profundi]SHK55345.1 thiamine-phosphate pyrophosphorylase [Rhodothermus profundi]